MKVDDRGFILGVYNYCDRWCEQCRFTSRCRVFVSIAEADAKHDPAFAAVPPLPEPRPSPELARILEALESEDEGNDANSLEFEEKPVAPAHVTMVERSRQYGAEVFRWLEARHDREDAVESPGPDEVIAHFALMIAAKIERALLGLANDDGDREFAPDFEGSAKVALIGIDRSVNAWQQVAAAGDASEVCGWCLQTLTRLRDELEGAIPGARGFVRPAFDEPDEVAALDRS